MYSFSTVAPASSAAVRSVLERRRKFLVQAQTYRTLARRATILSRHYSSHRGDKDLTWVEQDLLCASWEIWDDHIPQGGRGLFSAQNGTTLRGTMEVVSFSILVSAEQSTL